MFQGGCCQWDTGCSDRCRIIRHDSEVAREDVKSFIQRCDSSDSSCEHKVYQVEIEP